MNSSRLACLFGFHDWCPTKWKRNNDPNTRTRQYFCARCKIRHPACMEDCQIFEDDGAVHIFTAMHRGDK